MSEKEKRIAEFLTNSIIVTGVIHIFMLENGLYDDLEMYLKRKNYPDIDQFFKIYTEVVETAEEVAEVYGEKFRDS